MGPGAEALVSRHGGCWPDELQRLLLEAALLPPERARTAFRQWRDAVDPEAIDAASYRLLPLLAHNLTDIEDPLVDRARGVLRHTWSKNQRLFHRAAAVVGALQGAGIPVMVLKGGALAVRNYASLGHRPMNDLDLLVPSGRAADARAGVSALGWTAAYPVEPGHLPYLHGVAFTDGRGCDVDLHWHAVFECCLPGDDELFWANAEPFETKAFRAMAPHPTELALQVAAHGLRWSVQPPLQWAADLYRLVATDGPRIDWARLSAHARQAGLTLQLSLTLGFVARALDAPIPGELLASLAAEKATAAERVEVRVRSSPPGLVQGLLAHWFDHRRMARTSTFLRRCRAFPSYLAAIWGLPSAAAVPAAAARKVGVRLRRWRRGDAGV